MRISNQQTDVIGDVISAIAELLKIAVPPTFELQRNPHEYNNVMNTKCWFHIQCY